MALNTMRPLKNQDSISTPSTVDPSRPSTVVIEGAEHDETTQKPRFSTPSIPLQDLYSGVIDGAEHDETTQMPRFSTPGGQIGVAGQNIAVFNTLFHFVI